jgi:RNA recognition motif-containing protein
MEDTKKDSFGKLILINKEDNPSLKPELELTKNTIFIGRLPTSDLFDFLILKILE